MIQEGELFGVVMEYIDGVSLSRYVENKGQLTETEALSYVDQIGQALEYIHQQNYLHRDVKPDNILLRRNQQDAVLIDFGLARIIATQGMTNALTEGYAPIEQYQTKGNFGAHTDVYALAATLYYLLTADGLRNQGQTSPVSALNRKYEGERLPEPKIYNPQISQRVNDAILTAMALEPEARTQNVLELRKSLGLVTIMPPPTQQKQSELKDAVPAIYTKQQQFLAAGKSIEIEVDIETLRVMLAMANRERERWLHSQSTELEKLKEMLAAQAKRTFRNLF